MKEQFFLKIFFKKKPNLAMELTVTCWEDSLQARRLGEGVAESR